MSVGGGVEGADDTDDAGMKIISRGERDWMALYGCQWAQVQVAGVAPCLVRE